nr:hypothetical protein [Tanacetum cinerariifolium]
GAARAAGPAPRSPDAGGNCPARGSQLSRIAAGLPDGAGLGAASRDGAGDIRKA